MIQHKQQPKHRWHIKTGLIMLIALVIGFTAPATTFAQSTAESTRSEQFQQAASEFKVPVELLLALSYNQSRWEAHTGEPSTSGGYGPLHLTTTLKEKSKRGESRQAEPTEKTLDKASQLTNVSSEQLKNDPQANIRAGAALLAEYGKQTNNSAVPTLLGDWAGAVAKMRATDDADTAKTFVESVYKTLQTGAKATTTDQQKLQLVPQITSPNEAKLDSLNLRHKKKRPVSSQTPECPPTLACKNAPAYHGNAPGDPGNYGNYSVANRPEKMDVKYIVIHDTEGYYQDSIDWFQNPESYASAHYVVRSSDGEVSQMVPTKDVAWHADNYNMNMHSIGIEHEGFAAQGASWYSEAMYQSSAKLVRYLADKYQIPLDREHIIGHDQYHAAKPEQTAGMHWDPGPFWNWEHFMKLVGEHDTSINGPGAIATITPTFATNQQPVTDCTEEPCQTLPAQGSNFTYLRTEPRGDAPLIRDPGLHPDGSSGTIDITDNSAKAAYGQRFAIAERRGDWTAIWFTSQKAWLRNSEYQASFSTPFISDDFRITPKAGKESIPIYGAALPETSAYPKDGIKDQPKVTPLQYTIKAGQQYVAYDKTTPTDFFYAWTIDGSVPYDHTVFVGKDKYIPISYNHRQAFVRADDVKILHF